MKPEDKARQVIDARLEAAGWGVQDHKVMDLSANRGVAVREFPLGRDSVDYLLYADAKVIATVEAKKESHSLVGVAEQSAKYAQGLPDRIPHYHNPIAFSYESTGKETLFLNRLDPNPTSRDVFTFHRPEELIRLATQPQQLRGHLQTLPELQPGNLWNIQIEAVQNLEASLATAKPRALIQMATGSGKTYTACTFAYRLIQYAHAKRVLFLVDRNTLGRQAFNEFQQYKSPYTNYLFTEEFPVQHLRHNSIESASKVCITTIQRLYSILKGEDEFDEANEEDSLFESANPLVRQPLPVV